MPNLTNKQLNTIVEVVIDIYGPFLSDSELSEAVGLVLEDISGFETVEANITSNAMNRVRSLYYESINTGRE